MSRQEKDALRMVITYAEMVNGLFADLTHRVRILEGVMLKNPQLVAEFQQSAKETKRADIPGLPRQLSALRQVVERLPE